MLKMPLFALAAISIIAVPVAAAPCKNPKTGKFMKCPPAPKKPVRCKDAKGKFTKCGTPGAKPA